MTTQDILELAARCARELTEPQRRAVLALEREPKKTHRASGYSSLAAFNLVWPGITELRFDRASMRDTYCLTDLGLAVQAALKARAHTKGEE